MIKQNTATTGRDRIIGQALALDIGPGVNEEQALDAIDHVLSRVEAVLASMRSRPGPRGRASGPEAYRRFMDSIRDPLLRQAGRVTVSETAAFMKVASRVNGHRLYISKGRVRVGRVDSTLPLGLVPGAVRPTYHNGRIASWIPADPESVGRAIDALGTEGIPSP